MRLTVLGCGDAFGSGGRLQTSFHLAWSGGSALVDCGATALIGMHRHALDPNAVGSILITHLHGDHFSGLVWWLLHAHHVSNRSSALTIAGPAGLRGRLQSAAEALFPGSSLLELRFPLDYREFSPGLALDVAGLGVTSFEVAHPSGAPAYALRLVADGTALGFSGDTSWVEELTACAEGVDIFVVDCFGYDTDIGSHMSWRTISAKRDQLRARRLMLTHMGPEMLARLGEIADPAVLAAVDGLVVEVGAGTGAAAVRPPAVRQIF